MSNVAPNARRFIVLHIIIGLEIGGAELMLKRLVESQQDDAEFQHSVVSLTNIGKVGENLQASGIELRALGMHSALDIPRVLWALIKLIRQLQPAIVQTWMYHSDLLGGLAAYVAGSRNVIWGVRGTAIPQSRFSVTQFVVTLCSLLSHYLPRVIVCCAESALAAHGQLGYDRRKMLVINNGYDMSLFNTDPLIRKQARAAFGFSDDDVVIGTVGRFDPLKDYRNFIRAAAAVTQNDDRIKLLMVGRGLDKNNSELNDWLAETGQAHQFILAGERNDVPLCLASLDIFCLSSVKEGFPNVVCEAMAMEVPCVVTNAGDAASIVSKTGIVVPVCDTVKLTKALMTMVDKGAERLQLGKLARRRIEDHYSIKIASENFKSLYSKLICGPKITSTTIFESK